MVIWNRELKKLVAVLSGLLMVGCAAPEDIFGSLDDPSGGDDHIFGGSSSPEGGVGSGASGGDSSSGLASCTPVADLLCGSHAVGDSSDFNSGATDVLDSYPIAVGNYDAPEVAYSFKATEDGLVSFQLVDPDPTAVDHDIFLLVGDVGCNVDAAVERGHNSLSFMAESGEEYYLVVDGYDGDEGAYEVAVECGAGSSPSPPSPDPATYGECVFGWTSGDMEAAPHLQIAQTAQYQDASLVPPLVAQQLVQGVQEDGWASVSNIDDVFEYVDSDGVYVFSMIDVLSVERFTWLRFYAGDTEVGYIFVEGGLEQAALVSDGDINECVVEGVSGASGSDSPDSGSSGGTPSGGGGTPSGGDTGSLDAGQVEWSPMDISGWPVTADLSSVTLSGGQICLEYDKKDVWPITHVGAANVEVVANPWVIAEHNGQWYGRTFEWMRPGQTCKNRSSVAGDHTGAWPFAPGETFQPTPGVTYYFMVSAPARFGSIMTVAERSNLVPVVWN